MLGSRERQAALFRPDSCLRQQRYSQQLTASATSMGNTSSTGEDENGERRDARMQVDESVAAGALIGAVAGGLIWWLARDSEKKQDKKESPAITPAVSQGACPVVRSRQYRRSNGQQVHAVFVDCSSQSEAFHAAKAQDRHRRDPVLDRPHGTENGSSRWHYHPALHDVWQDGKLFNYHYNFDDRNEIRIRSLDRQLCQQ